MKDKINPNYVTTVRNRTNVEIEKTSVILLTSNNYKMKSYGPKPLIKLMANTTLLEHQLKTISAAIPNVDTFLCVGEDADKIIKYRSNKLRIIENQNYESTNEAEYIRLALNAVTTDKVIIIGGDLYFDVEVLKHLNDINESCLVYDSLNRMKDSEIGMTVVENKATIFSYKIPTKWCSIVSLIGKDIEYARSILLDRTRSRCFAFEILNTLIDKFPMRADEVRSAKLFKIESTKDLESLQNEIKNTYQ